MQLEVGQPRKRHEMAAPGRMMHPQANQTFFILGNDQKEAQFLLLSGRGFVVARHEIPVLGHFS